MCVHIYIYMCIYTYIHIYIHTHIYKFIGMTYGCCPTMTSCERKDQERSSCSVHEAGCLSCSTGILKTEMNVWQRWGQAGEEHPSFFHCPYTGLKQKEWPRWKVCFPASWSGSKACCLPPSRSRSQVCPLCLHYSSFQIQSSSQPRTASTVNIRRAENRRTEGQKGGWTHPGLNLLLSP